MFPANCQLCHHCNGDGFCGQPTTGVIQGMWKAAETVRKQLEATGREFEWPVVIVAKVWGT